ncbi:MAG: MFS transporter [Deltaproteobacteria bacterium]|jgi:MFS family permease|nr:MFS transporter [Deltaproteobacteria bacterium]
MASNPADFYRGQPDRHGVPKLLTRGFAAFALLNVFIFLGFDVLLPTLTLWLESHGHSRDAIGRIFSFFMLAAIVMRMVAPRLAARFRPFTLMRLGLAVSALSSAGYFLARSAPAASLARFGHGLGFGLTSTILTALAAQIIPPSKMGQGMGLLGLGAILTLSLGPSLGLWLKDTLGFLPLFLTVSGIYLGGLLWTLTMPDLTLAGQPAAGQPKPPRLTLLSRLVWAPSLMMALTGVSISAVTVYLALFFNELQKPWSGLFFGLSAIGVVISRLFAGRLHDRCGHQLVIPPALACMLGTMILLINLAGPATLTAAAVLWGLSVGAAFPSVQAVTFTSAPPDRRAEASSSLFNAFDLGLGGGSIVFGLLSELFQTYRAAFYGASANCLLFLGFYAFHYLRPWAAKRRKTAQAARD